MMSTTKADDARQGILRRVCAALSGVLLLAGLVGIARSVTFTDQAGRVIYAGVPDLDV